MASRKNRSRRNCRKNNSRRNNSRRNSRRNNSRRNNSRRNNSRRNNSRRNNSRRNSRRNNMVGGAYSPMNLSLEQGREYNAIHANQRGGGYLPAPLAGAPVGYTGVLDSGMRDAARIAPLDGKLSEIVGMRDPDQVPVASPQTGGGRRRRGRKGSKKGRKSSRRNRTQRGGAMAWAGAPLSSPNMLLTPSQAAKAGTADFSNPWLRD